MAEDLEHLESKRAQLYRELSEIGDLRRGSIETRFRRCGKPGCVCAGPDHPGHGPQYLLMTKEGGKSVCKNLRPGPELEKAQREVANHRRFRDVIGQIVDVNEEICAARPIQGFAMEPEVETQKKTSSAKSRKNSPNRSIE
ncbi:MAG: hypothetical protein M0Z41_00010 [Peptococcaceae bacterium]|nr:hypothetical protein [Peptococcaceae bacterium]